MEFRGIIAGCLITSEEYLQNNKADYADYILSILNKINPVYPFTFHILKNNDILILIDNPANLLFMGVLIKSGFRANLQSTTTRFKSIKLLLKVVPSQGLSPNEFIKDNSTINLEKCFTRLEIPKKVNLSVITPWESVNDEFSVSFPLLDVVMREWTTGHANAIFFSLLKNCNKKELAKFIGQTNQNASRLLLLAKEKEIKNLIHRFQTVISSQISQMKEIN